MTPAAHDGPTPAGRFRALWCAAVMLTYAAFFFWYGGSGRPLDAAEGQQLLTRLRTTPDLAAHPELLQGLETLIAHDDGREFFMTNLITMKTGPEAAASDAAYTWLIGPALIRRACFPVYVGQVHGVLLGDDGSGVDRVAVVRYRSLRDFLEIFADPAMADAAKYKFASLSHTEVMATSPLVSAVTIRLTAALVGMSLAALPWLAAGASRRRR